MRNSDLVISFIRTIDEKFIIIYFQFRKHLFNNPKMLLLKGPGSNVQRRHVAIEKAVDK